MSRRTRVLPLLIALLLVLPRDASAQKERFFARKAKVTLKNGSVISGIVRTKTVYELQRGSLFVAVDLDRLRADYEAAKDAALRARKPLPRSPFPRVGIRLWFVMGNEGYVFLLKRDVTTCRLEQAVAEKDFKEIERQSAERARMRKVRRAKLEKLRKQREALAREKKEQEAASKAGEQTGTDGNKKPAQDAPALTIPKGYELEEDWVKAARALLAKFPEKEGWGKDKKSYDWLKYKYQRTKARLTRRTIVINGKTRTVLIKKGIPRTAIENEFFASYTLWVEAGKWNEAGKLDPPGKAAGSTPTKKSPGKPAK